MASDSKHAELEALWKEAVKEFSITSERKFHPERWQKLSITDDDLQKQIEQHEHKFLEFRKSRRKFWDAFMSTMTQVQRLGKIVQAGIGLTPFAPASIIIEAGLFLVESGSAVKGVYDSLEELFKKLQSITSRLSVYVNDKIDHRLRELVIGLLCSILNVFNEAEAAIERGRGKEMFRHIVGKENKIQIALQDLETKVEEENKLIAAMTLATVNRISNNAEVERNREVLRTALQPSAVGYNKGLHADIEESRVKESGEWLLQVPLFQEWTRMEFPVLCVLGDPGTGKTYLASRAVSHLQGSSANVASYFYIREGMQTQHTTEVILKTIATQVAEFHDSYRKLAIKACREDQTLFRPSSIWDNLFINLFNKDSVASKPLFIVIDGVDEATQETQELLVKMAKQLSDSRSKGSKLPAIQLLFLGRPELERSLSNGWRGEKRLPMLIHVQPSLSKPDIEKFIKKGVKDGVLVLSTMEDEMHEIVRKLQKKQDAQRKETLQKLLKKRKKSYNQLKRQIVAKLCASSDGMFLLAKLMLAEIRDANKPELIEEALNKPPSGLDDMFKRTISRLLAVGGFEKSDLNEMIMWVACAERDLLLGELDLVLKLRDLNQNGIMGLETELRTRFGSFFNIAYADSPKIDEEDVISVIEGDAEDGLEPSTSEPDSEPLENIDTDSDYYASLGGSGDDNTDESEDEDDASEYDIDEDEDEVSDAFYNATVKFGHASIGQYFRTETIYENIGMDLNLSQVHVALTCVLVLNGNLPKKHHKPWRHPDLSRYSADHFLDHLAKAKLDGLESPYPDEFQRLSVEISILFNDQVALLHWFNTVPDNRKFMSQLFSQTTCSVLQQWISLASVKTSSDPQWLERAKVSSESLLEPFAISISKTWLEQGECSSLLAVIFLKGYASLRSDPPIQWELPNNLSFQHIAESISPDEIRLIASISGLDGTLMWHDSLATTFKDIQTNKHQLAAAEEYLNSVQKSAGEYLGEPACISAAELLLKLGRYEEAIAAASRALEYASSIYPSRAQKSLMLIGKAHLQLDNPEAAYKIASEMWKSAPQSLFATMVMIHISYQTDHSSDAVEAIKSLLDPKLFKADYFTFEPDPFDGLMQDVSATNDILRVCKKTNQLSLAEELFTTISNQSGTTSIRAKLALAKLNYQFYEDTYKAIEILENIAEDHTFEIYSVHASYELASLYLNVAVDPTTAVADTWISKLNHLLARWEPLDLGIWDMISAVVGHWHARRGEFDLARARILPLVKASLPSMSKFDAMTDSFTCHRLGKSLAYFGDRVNASVAFSFGMPLQKPREFVNLEASGRDGRSDEVHSNRHEWDDESLVVFDSRFHCDGLCNRQKVKFRSFSVCEICIDIHFCDECLQKFKTGNLPFRVCNTDHPLLQIYPPRGLVTKTSEGYMVRINDEMVSAGVWLDSIRKEWLGDGV